jgi:hypothetical protein
MPSRLTALTRHCPAALLAIAAAGCASSGGVADHTPSIRSESVRGPGIDLNMQRLNEPGVRVDVISDTPVRVYNALQQVYSDLSVPVTSSDPESKVIASNSQRMRTIADRSMADYFDCGGGYGNNASRFSVYVTLVSQARSDGGSGTALRSSVSAIAKAPAQSTEVTCNSKGVLERLISDRVKVKLATS